MRYYTGVGSRRTPESVLRIMVQLAMSLSARKIMLRTGDAHGADAAFTTGAGLLREVYTPEHVTGDAMNIAQRHHPAWRQCTPWAKRLHARNAFQVLGRQLDDPSEFLICWTPDGWEGGPGRSIATGGTGTAISIAVANCVPVFNLQRADAIERLRTFVRAFE